MDPVTSHAIDLIEAAYDLEVPDADWLPNLIDAAVPIVDHGLGVFGFTFLRPAGAGGKDAVIGAIEMRSLRDDFPERFAEASRALSPEFVKSVTPPGYAGPWSEISKDHPEEFARLLEKLGYEELF